MAHTVFTRSHSCDQTLGQLGIVSGSPQDSTAPIGAAFFHHVGLLLALLHQVTPILTSIPCMIFHLPRVFPKKYATSKSVNHHFPCSTLGHTIPFADRQKKDKKNWNNAEAHPQMPQRRGFKDFRGPKIPRTGEIGWEWMGGLFHEFCVGYYNMEKWIFMIHLSMECYKLHEWDIMALLVFSIK